MTDEDLDRFARQTRHKLLNPQPVLDHIAELEARNKLLEDKFKEAELDLEAQKAPKKKVHISQEGVVQ